jgi:hypothetical protein
MNAISPFSQVGPALHARGYSPIPIQPGGKKPAGSKWQQWCEQQPPPLKIEAWARSPNGVGIACGRGLVCIDIDRDELIPVLAAILPPAVVGRRGRKGVAWFYRGDTSKIASRNYRDEDKRGLVDLLSAGKQAVVPPTIHPDTSKAYEWTTARTLLDTELEELPELPDDIGERIAEALKPFGYVDKGKRSPSAPRPEPRSRAAVQADNGNVWRATNDAALANIAAWAPFLSLPKGDWHGLAWRAVAAWRSSGSGRDAEARSPNLSISPTGIQDFGTGETFTAVHVTMRALSMDRITARDWLRERLGLPPVADGPTSIEPTYPDNRMAVDDARKVLADLIRDFFGDRDPTVLLGAVREYRAASNAFRARLPGAPLLEPKPPAWLVRVEPGLGKTALAIAAIAASRGLQVDYVMPRHKLGDEIAKRFAKHGVRAEVYRGYDRPDPEAPGHKMCRDTPAYEAARDCGANIRSSICGAEGGPQCKLADVCGRERQRHATSKVWILPAALLPHKRPDFIPEADLVIIDERFHMNTVRDKATSVRLADIADAGSERLNDDERILAERYRRALVNILQGSDDNADRKHLSRAALLAQGIAASDARHMSDFEHRRATINRLTPDMDAAERKRIVREDGKAIRHARVMADFWREIGDFLDAGHDAAGRIWIKDAETFGFRPLMPVHESWHAPTLILDGTAPDADLLSIALGLPVSPKADITARYSPHVMVRQITNAPVGMWQLGIRDGKVVADGKRNRNDILRFIKLRAAQTRGDLVVISYKRLLEAFEQVGLPKNVKTCHFGALSGLNDFERAAGLIVIGRQLPQALEIEALAEAFSGQPMPLGDRVPRPTKGSAERPMYPKVSGCILLASGEVVGTTMYRHHNPVAEALRWQSVEGELIQAIGRARALGRTAETPCSIDIVCDVPLPIVVDVVEVWERPGAVAEMSEAGVLLTNARDMMTVFGLTEREARRDRGLGRFPIESIHNRETSESSRRVRYQPTGAGHKSRDAIVLPNGPRTPSKVCEWLEEKIGPMAAVEAMGCSVQPGARKRRLAIFEHIGRMTFDWVRRLGAVAEMFET